MKPSHLRAILLPAMVLLAAGFAPAPLQAADLVITGTVNGIQTYSSTEGMLFEAAVIDTGARITATANVAVRLKNGTRIADGARLAITIPDNDGLSNVCEMTYFGDLTHDPAADDDGDGLTNIQECRETLTNPNTNDTDNDGIPDVWEMDHGLDPRVDNTNRDSDADGLNDLNEYQAGTSPIQSDSDDDSIPDGWEVLYGLNPLTNDDADADLDGDGIPNRLEYKYQSVPNNAESRPAGFYQYDFDDNGNLLRAQ